MFFVVFDIFWPPPWKKTVSENGKMAQNFRPPIKKVVFFVQLDRFFDHFLIKPTHFLMVRIDQFYQFYDHPWKSWKMTIRTSWFLMTIHDMYHDHHRDHQKMTIRIMTSMPCTMTMIGSDVPTMESDHPCHKTMMVRIDIFMTHHQILAGPPKMTSGPLHF